VEPAWQWNKESFDRILRGARNRHGKAAQALANVKFREQLAKAATDATFVETAEALRRQVKAKELCQSAHIPQVRWVEKGKIADDKLLKLQEQFLPQGVFVVRELSSAGETCRVFVVPTTDLFAVFGAFGTNGNNMGLTPELTIAWLMDLHGRHPLHLIGIGHDGAEFRFVDPIQEPKDLVDELMTVCPPEFEEKNFVRQLRDKLKSKTPQVYLWWD
jgi:hypothetical protein